MTESLQVRNGMSEGLTCLKTDFCDARDGLEKGRYMWSLAKRILE